MDHEIEIGEEKPRFVMVELSQLEQLLQRCIHCGKLPGGTNAGKTRPITWKRQAVYGFYMCMFLNLVIAWNRFAAVFLYGHYENRVFNKKMVVFYIAMVHLTSALANIPAFTYHMKYFPELGHHTFVNMPSDEYLRIWKICDLVLSYTLHAWIVIMYIAAFISYKRMNVHMYHKHHRNRRFLYQAMLNAIPCLLYINCYHFNIATVELFLAELCMVMNPFVYLWFNAELRNDFLTLVHLKRSFSEDAHVAPHTPFDSHKESRQGTSAHSHSYEIQG